MRNNQNRKNIKEYIKIVIFAYLSYVNIFNLYIIIATIKKNVFQKDMFTKNFYSKNFLQITKNDRKLKSITKYICIQIAQNNVFNNIFQTY